MSRFTGNIGREEEDGLGWEGLIPSKEERRKPAAEPRPAQDWLARNHPTTMQVVDTSSAAERAARIARAIVDAELSDCEPNFVAKMMKIIEQELEKERR